MEMEEGEKKESIYYGKKIKKERDIERELDMGIRIYEVDWVEEVEKIERVEKGRRVLWRVMKDGEGEEWKI